MNSQSDKIFKLQRSEFVAEEIIDIWDHITEQAELASQDSDVRRSMMVATLAMILRCAYPNQA